MGRSGCGNPLLFGCGCLLLILGIASVAITFKAQDILAWWFSEIEETLVRALPSDVTLNERQRLQAAFADLRAALRDGEVDAAALARMQNELGGALGRAAQGTLTREDVERLTAAIEQAARPSTAPASPTPDDGGREARHAAAAAGDPGGRAWSASVPVAPLERLRGVAG